MVLVALDHPDGSVENRGNPRLVFRQRVFFVPHAVRLVVRLVDDVEAEDIAHVVERDAVRVMAGADRVDIRLFHQAQVADDIVLAHRVAGERVVLMAVGPLDQGALAVDLEQAVFHLGAAEAGDKAEAAGRLLVCLNGEKDRIEPGLLGRPLFGVRDRDVGLHHTGGAGLDLESGVVSGGLGLHGNTVDREGLVYVVVHREVFHLSADSAVDRLATVVLNRRRDVKNGVLVVGVQFGNHL